MSSGAAALALDDFRCPRTGGRLTQAADGGWIGPDGDVYPLVEGLRFLLPDGKAGADISQLYDTLSRAGEGEAKAVAYVSPASFRRTADNCARLLDAEIRGQAILDVGCGHGEMSRHLAGSNHVVGIDLTPALLRQAQRQGVEAYVADATRLPFRDGLFDRALCVNVIQVVPDPAALLASIARVVRIGGKVLLVAINGESIIRRLYRSVLDAGYFRPRGIPYDSYPKLQPLARMREWLGQSGLEIRSVGMSFAPSGRFGQARYPSPLQRRLADTFYLQLERTR